MGYAWQQDATIKVPAAAHAGGLGNVPPWKDVEQALSAAAQAPNDSAAVGSGRPSADSSAV